MDLILAIGLMVVIGFFGGCVARKLKFPRITGYIIIGVLLSPSVLNIISKGTVENLDIITDIALGIIAYLVGGSLHIESLRKLKKSIALITPFQSLGAWFFVTFSIAFLCPFILTIPEATFYQTYFPIAFVIGAVSCATAPAATMAIIHEYKAKGPLTTTLLAVVALDDAIAIGAFSIALGISKPLVSGIGGVSLIQMLGIPFLQIAESIAIGIVFGFALVYISRVIRIRELLLVIIFGMIMLCIGVANLLGISAILANMVVGFIVVNKAKRKEMLLVVEEIEDVIFAMFFVLAGLHFDLSVMESAFILALLIVLTRCVGKYMGTRIGATISHAPDTVKNYLGLALLPKAGVTVGLVLLAERAFPAFGAILVNAVIASVIINELIAPPLVKYAIFKAKESGT
ncbi:MAG: cation:proton antiporter [Euryarchaeota archaeon]|nr:cation:proton antiporter [Euryarchaeota archaeon]